MYVKYKQLCKEGEFCPGDVFDYDYGGGHIYNLELRLHGVPGLKLSILKGR